jgi:prophage regulatory protein
MAKRFLGIRKVEDKVDKKKSWIYEKARKGEFPSPVRLNERCTVWIEDEIDEWMDERIARHRNSH